MNLPKLEIYAVEKTGRRSACGYLQRDGTKVVLKPKQDFSDRQVIRYLYEIQMQGIPHIWGETKYQEEVYLILSWLDGEPINKVNLPYEKINQAIFAVLALIDKLQIITGKHWFFLDLKPQHVLIDPVGKISLIDFEHVVVSKEKKIPAKNLNRFGISPIYSSAEFKTGQFSQKHHEYALALIWLSLLSKKSIEDLTIQNRKRVLSKLNSQIKLRIESALKGEGIRIKSKKPIENSKIIVNQTNPTEQDNSQYVSQNKVTKNILQIVQNHMQDTLLKVSNDSVCEYKRHSFFECHNSKKQELIIYTDIKSIMLCECHALPILTDLKFAYLSFNKNIPNTLEIFQIINLFSHELQNLNLLTKNLASHIVKKYSITDLYISNEYLNLCDFKVNKNFDFRQIQEYKSGEFTINSRLSDQVSKFKHSFWR